MAIDLSLKGIENGIRLVVPMALLAVLFMFSIISMPIGQYGAVKPSFLLMAVYYWSIYRPTLMPPVLCFIIGMLVDIVSGLPLGVNAAILTLAQWVVRDQRKFLMGQAYITIWAVFVLVAAVALFLQWGLYGFAQMHWSPVMPVFINIGITALVFPLVSILLVMTHKVLPAPPKAFT